MKKLQIRFILLTMLCLTVILAALVAVLNVMSYHSMVKSADRVLSILSENQGQFPDMNDDDDRGHDHGEPPPEGQRAPAESAPEESTPAGSAPGAPALSESRPREDREPREQERTFFFSAELPHESRFFSVLLNEENALMEIETSHIAAISDERAIRFASRVAEHGDERGFFGIYRYVKVSEPEGLRVIFLDTSNTMGNYFSVLFNSIGIALILLLLVLVIVSFLSNRILRPIAESYEMQRQFISDAGHELKTPLTIIRADADVLEMDLGKNEWLEDIQRQTDRLGELTNNLLLLSRMEDTRSAITMIDFPLSDCVAETVASFETLAKARERDLTCHVEPLLTLRGDERAIRQLVSVLMDNAIKYSPKGGVIRLRLERSGRAVQLTVYNTTEETLPRESLPRLFDRFYRVDSARNSGVGGHGIGLSLAKAIVDVHNGKIQAGIPGERAIVFTVTLPL